MTKLFYCYLIYFLSLSSCKAQNIKEQISETNLEYQIQLPKVTILDPPLLIFLHGYGSNEVDLFSLSKYIPQNYFVVAARAPITLGEDSYAWYKIDRTNNGEISYTESEAEQARKSLVTFITSIQKKYKIDKSKVVLFGFSQGAILSYSVALTRPDLIDGIAVMSGRLLSETKDQTAKDLSKLNVFISHGINDKMISIKEARNAKEYLLGLKINPIYKEFNEGHTINTEMMGDFLNWLHNI